MTSRPGEAAETISSAQKEQLWEAAKAAAARAYAPYSKFHVGAALLAGSGAIYTGCNVENASYGLTNCAERSAIFSGVGAEGDKFTIRAIAVYNANQVACSPCGACRQVIFEFGPAALVMFQGRNGREHASISDLLPAGFSL